MNTRKPTITRTTGMGLAFAAALEAVGIDTSGARMPTKREPTWTVTRRKKR